MVNSTAEGTLSMQEIERRYQGEWVLIGDPELGEGNRVLRGKLLFHSKSRNEVDAEALKLRPRHSAFLFTGPFPEDLLINL